MTQDRTHTTLENLSWSACLLLLSLAGSTVFADPPPPAPVPGDEYSNPTPGASAPNPLDQIQKDAANLACENNLCTLFSVTVNKRTFNITTYVGTGQAMSQNGGTNNYYGGYNPGTNGTNLNNGRLGYGVQITWDSTKCTKNVNVDRTVYDSVTTYMRELMNHKPGEEPTFPQFTPAEQTMILFYTTVMELTKGNTCS